MLAPAFEAGRTGSEPFKSWEDRDASSRDGDDEDNADESEEGEGGGTRSENSTLPQRSRTASLSSLKGRQIRYRDRAVQTVPREMRSQAVQVSVTLPKTTPATEQGKRSRQGSSSIKRLWPPATSAGVLQPVVVQDTGVGQDPSAIATPLPSRPSKPSVKLPAPSSPSSMYSPQELVLATSPTLVGSSMESISPTHAVRMVLSGSPPLSPADTLSPPAGQGSVMPVRKAGRVWDPARGVELFKKGSEGVLARFLKMGSWEGDAAIHAPERA